jgi:hypothetical protein
MQGGEAALGRETTVTHGQPRSPDGRTHPELDAQGYYSYTVAPLPGPIANVPFFWKATVTIPASKRFLPGGYTITARTSDSSSGSSVNSQPLDVRMLGPGGVPDSVPRPSSYFHDGKENSKEFWSEIAIVAHNVTLAGWLQGPLPGEPPESDLQNRGRNNGDWAFGPGASEDWHYNLWLDEDFLEQNYGPDDYFLRKAIMVGNGNEPKYVLGIAPRIRLLYGSSPTIDTFMLPGSSAAVDDRIGGLIVELNAWHMRDTPRTTPDGKPNGRGGKGRGPKPQPWVLDPFPSQYDNNAWPFDQDSKQTTH